jgi:hypothetical protein
MKCLFGGLRGGKIGADGKMHYNPGWEPGSMKTLAAHGLAGGIVQDRMGGSLISHTLISANISIAIMYILIKQIPKRPRLCPVCEFTAANHRDGATNNWPSLLLGRVMF